MMKRISTYLILASLFVGLSCSEELNPQPYEYTRLLTNGSAKTWVLSHYAFTENGEVDNSSILACYKDDRHTFWANPEKSIQVTGGENKCVEDEPGMLINDTWSFNNANATLIVEISLIVGKLPYFIRDLDEDDLVLEIFIDQESIFSYRIYFEAVEDE